MKKVFALMSIVAMFSMVACGPSKNHDEEAEKKRIEDSTHMADSIAAAQEELNKKMEEEMAQDTTNMDTTGAMEETHEGHEGDHN